MKISKVRFRQEALSDQQRRVCSKKSARLREAAFSLRSHCDEGGPAKAGNAAGGFFQQPPLGSCQLSEYLH